MSDAPRDPTEVLRNVSALEAAEQRAFLRGQESAQWRAKVESHETRLNAMNGSIARLAKAVEQTNDHLSELRTSVDTSTKIAKTRADVAAELAKTTAAKTVDRRTFITTVVVAATGVAGVVVAAIQLIGHA